MKSWSKTQASVALSSGEAEYISMVKGAVEGFGVQSLAADLGWHLKLRLWVDSAAATSIASRKGVGKVRHLEVRHLWLQEAVRRGSIGKVNPADALTKPQSGAELARLASLVGVQVTERFRDGGDL